MDENENHEEVDGAAVRRGKKIKINFIVICYLPTYITNLF